MKYIMQYITYSFNYYRELSDNSFREISNKEEVLVRARFWFKRTKSIIFEIFEFFKNILGNKWASHCCQIFLAWRLFSAFFYLFITGRGSMILLQMLSTKNRGDVGKGLSKIAKTIYIQKLKKDVCKEQHFSIL